MENTEWMDQRKCATCGKKFTVLRPQLWAYKRGTPGHMKYYCSWSCLRKSEGKDETEMGKLTLEIKKKAVEIAIDGGDPLKYLEECGYTAPDKMWGYIKSRVKESNPEMYEQIPDRRNRKATVEVADKLPEAEKEWTPAEEVYPKEGERITTDKPSFVELEKPKAEKILGQEPLEVAAVFSRVIKGAQYIRNNFGTMDLLCPVSIKLTAYQWFQFSEEILVAIRQLDMTNPSRALEPEEYTGNNAPLKG